MSLPTVSVCLPCRNAAPFLKAALDSILAQTYQALEIIVVDDGSTDGSAEILRGYRCKGVKVIHQSCGSAAMARNRALREATGDYVKFFDADDLMSPGMVEQQMQRLAGRDDAVATSEWGRFQQDDLSTFRSNPEKVWRDMDAGDWLVEAWRDARPMMQPGLFLIPRRILEAAGPWDGSLTLIDDFEFFARVLCHSRDVRFTQGAILYYRSGVTGSLSGRKTRQAVESAFQALLKGTGHLLATRGDPAAKTSCANLLQDFIYTYYPEHPDLRKMMENRIRELGGSTLPPGGPPRFQTLRRWTGWKVARRIQLMCGGRKPGL